MRTKKVKPPTRIPGPYVLAASDIVGVDPQTGILRLRGSLFASLISVQGMDIIGQKPADRETVYGAFGAAEQNCKLDHKIVICDRRPDYHTQLYNVERLLEQTTHPFRRNLLERHRAWILHYQENQTNRDGFVFFFSKDQADCTEAQHSYIAQLSTAQIEAHVCDWREELEADQFHGFQVCGYFT